MKKKALIFAARSEIAQGLKALLLQRDYQVITTGRGELGQEYLFDTTDEQQWSQIFSRLKDEYQDFDILISCVGWLHDKNFSPEKSLKDISLDHMLQSFSSNYFASALFAKYSEPLIAATRPSDLIFLSAMVGSIADNRIGGWYSYRASKAALNMLVKNLAIYYSRKKPQCKVLSVHPGTTDTKMSRPFSSAVKHSIWSPQKTAEHILDVVASTSLQQSGLFFKWDGSQLEW